MEAGPEKTIRFLPNRWNPDSSYLGDIDLSGIHELQDGRKMLEGDVFQNDDGMFGGVLLQLSLEVGATGGEDHLVSLAALAVACKRRLKTASNL